MQNHYSFIEVSEDDIKKIIEKVRNDMKDSSYETINESLDRIFNSPKMMLSILDYIYYS